MAGGCLSFVGRRGYNQIKNARTGEGKEEMAVLTCEKVVGRVATGWEMVAVGVGDARRHAVTLRRHLIASRAASSVLRRGLASVERRMRSWPQEVKERNQAKKHPEWLKWAGLRSWPGVTEQHFYVELYSFRAIPIHPDWASFRAIPKEMNEALLFPTSLSDDLLELVMAFQL
jgi:hypothetical protein